MIDCSTTSPKWLRTSSATCDASLVLPSVTLGVVVFGSLCVIVLNLLVDLLYAVIDPRIRLS